MMTRISPTITAFLVMVLDEVGLEIGINWISQTYQGKGRSDILHPSFVCLLPIGEIVDIVESYGLE